MLSIKRTDSSNPDFIQLVKLLDAFLAECDGDQHLFYADLNKVVNLRQVVVAYDGVVPVGCGAIREYDSQATEVKRMYVLPEFRGRGIASLVLRELEAWAAELGFDRCVLETGKRQPEAIGLYRRNDYEAIPNYGKYIGIENSVCFEKKLGKF